MPMEPINIKGWADLLDNVLAIKEQRREPLWFRGEREQWPLLPKIFRSPSLMEKEALALFTFMRDAPSRYAHCPTEDNYAAWLTLAQHYGLATRLLDWSRSLAVAAFFAVNGEDTLKHTGAMFALAPEALNESQGFPRGVWVLSSAGSRRSLAREAFGDLQRSEPRKRPPYLHEILDQTELRQIPEQARVAAVSPRQIDPRLLVQHGSFTIHRRPEPLEDFCNAGDFLTVFHISPEAKRSISRALGAMQISVSHLFPDLDHLAEDVMRSL